MKASWKALVFTLSFRICGSNCSSLEVPLGRPEAWDYVIVGSGPAGLVVADKLSETGKRTLLLERGGPSTYASGGREGPPWIRQAGEPLSRFDVPGFFAAFQEHTDGHQCDDVKEWAACVLGGGAAVNSGIYIMPPDSDWAEFPSNWKPDAMRKASERALQRIAGTDTPSQDGKTYFPEAFDVAASLAKALGMREIRANEEANSRNWTYSRLPFMSIDGERGGPLGSYLLAALKRPNFELRLHSKVQRVNRMGGLATSVDYVQNTTDGKSTQVETVYVASGGRVVLSAGAFGTPKILFHSKIGRQDQLEIAEGAGNSINAADQLIDLPVGHNLMDHAASHIVLRHPSIGPAYNYSEAYCNPHSEDAKLYLDYRSGPLATSNGRISLWDERAGLDGKERVIQWNGRAATQFGINGPNHLLLTGYLTRGLTSRGQLGLNESTLDVEVTSSPYLQTEGDKNAVISAFSSLFKAVRNVPGLELVGPNPDTTAEDWIRNYPKDVSRGSNHWLGSCKMGDDDGRRPGGTAVVDRNTKVWGTDNLYVVDASIFPGMVTSNPVGAIITMAEHATELIKNQE